MMLTATTAVFAQEKKETPTVPQKHESGMIRKVKPSFGDYFEAYSRRIAYDRIVSAYRVEVTYDKTTTIIFPSGIEAVDLGSAHIIAGILDRSENVLRVKAAVKGFDVETNLGVLTAEGSYYTFNIRYADELARTTIEMKDFMHDGEAINRPNNAMEIYLRELGNESPKLVNLINRSIHKNNKRHVKHIGSKAFGIQYLLKGIYSHNNLLYLHTQIKNESNVPFDVDFVRMKIVDKKVAKRTAIQETVIYPLRAFNYVERVNGNRTERTVFAIDKITIPDDKQLIIELFEKNGGRHQEFIIENEDIVRARVIDELKVK